MLPIATRDTTPRPLVATPSQTPATVAQPSTATARVAAPADAFADAIPTPPKANLWKDMKDMAQFAPQIRQLQDCLVHLGYLTHEEMGDGYGSFGPLTEERLGQFQVDHGLLAAGDPARGSYGERTRGKLQEVLGGAPRVDLTDPAQTTGWPSPGMWGELQKKRFSGPLFDDAGLSVTDIKQGQIGDCFFAGSVSALAAANPQALRDMITDNGDGTYTVAFKGIAPQTVDGDLYVFDDGSMPYGRDVGGNTDPASMEMWFAVAEKAYAQARGSYEAINWGDWPGTALTHLTGRPTDAMKPTDKDSTWARITQSVDSREPLVAYAPSNNHTYGIISYGRDPNSGDRLVTVKNPFGGGPANDGVITMDLDEFMRTYDSLMWPA